VYGYFFERLGAKVLSVFVGYPPSEIRIFDDLSQFKGRRVLILEDDVISGVTLTLVVEAVMKHEPAWVGVYLGRRKEDQQLGSIPQEVSEVFLAEDILDDTRRAEYESEFIEFFSHNMEQRFISP